MAPSTRSSQAAAESVASSTLDLLMLTFNCAKNLINVAIFAKHLQTALGGDGSSGLPDVVVL